MLGKPERALAHYRRAIKSYSACGRCWMGVAEAQSVLRQDPIPALERAIEYGSSSTDVRTRAASLLARSGRLDEAATEFGAALGGRREDRWEFYSLLHRVYDGEFVIENIITDADAESYLVYALTALAPSGVERAYDLYRAGGEDDPELRDTYVLYLLRRGLAHDAWRIAFEDGRDCGLIDTAFEGPTRYGHFGWKIRDVEGVDADVVRCDDCGGDRAALRLRFDGEHNVHFQEARVTVPVLPGYQYRMSARLRHEELTSASGPGILVRGIADQTDTMVRSCDLWALSETLQGSSDWRTLSVDFLVPDECEGIRLYVARPRTKRLDQFVSGELWVDEIDLSVLSTPADRAVEVEQLDDRENLADNEESGTAPEYAVDQRPLALSTY
jgi:tetratricopeptide (TPR) repeat protein